MKWALIAVLVVLLLVGGVAVAEAHAAGGPASTYEELARYWAGARGLPVAWVLATIEVESGGKAGAVGDQHLEGGSVGLMQINWHAHGQEIQSHGLTREDLYTPNVNIDWGTKILASSLASARAAIGETGSEIPEDELMRLRYKGVPILNKLRAGEDPRVGYEPTIANWRRAVGHYIAAEVA